MATRHGTTEYPNTFKRQGDFPLDITTKFKSMTDAENYAKTNPTAYGGQIISVLSSNNKYKPFILQPNDSETGFVLELMQGTDINLGDDVNITFDGGKAV